MSKGINLGFFGDDLWALNSLKLIKKEKSFIIKFICLRKNQPDKRIIKFAKRNNIKYFIFKNVNAKEALLKIESFKIDFIISMSYDQIFKKNIIKKFKSRIVNCHAANLPFYRGRSPLNWALINDEKYFGITVHYINNKIDQGDIILQKKYRINNNDDFFSIMSKAYEECPKLLFRALKLIKVKNVNPIKQSSICKKGSYFRKRGPGDEIINWDRKSREIFSFIRGLSKPAVMAKTYCKKDIVYINKSDPKFINVRNNFLPGTILEKTDQFFIVKTSNSAIKIKEWKGKVKKGLRFI